MGGAQGPQTRGGPRRRGRGSGLAEGAGHLGSSWRRHPLRAPGRKGRHVRARCLCPPQPRLSSSPPVGLTQLPRVSLPAHTAQHPLRPMHTHRHSLMHNLQEGRNEGGFTAHAGPGLPACSGLGPEHLGTRLAPAAEGPSEGLTCCPPPSSGWRGLSEAPPRQWVNCEERYANVSSSRRACGGSCGERLQAWSPADPPPPSPTPRPRRLRVQGGGGGGLRTSVFLRARRRRPPCDIPQLPQAEARVPLPPEQKPMPCVDPTLHHVLGIAGSLLRDLRAPASGSSESCVPFKPELPSSLTPKPRGTCVYAHRSLVGRLFQTQTPGPPGRPSPLLSR